MMKRALCAAAAVVVALGVAASAGAQGDLDPLLKILVRKGVLTHAEAREVQREHEAEQSRHHEEMKREIHEDMPKGASDVDIGYKFGKGVTFEKGDMSLNVGGRVQVRYDAAQEDAGIISGSFGTSRENEKETFDIRRARVHFKGSLTDDLGYEVQFDIADDAELRKAYITYQPYEIFGLTGGQYKVPFGREELNSSGNLQFVDRSITNRFFHPGYDVGLSLGGQSSDDGRFHWALGAFNGEGAGSDNRDGKFLWAARVGYDPFGYFKPSGSDIGRSEDPKLAFAAQYLQQSMEDDADLSTWGLDFAYQQHGFSVEGGWYDGELDPGHGAESFEADGWRLQAGYMVYQNLVEIAARYAEVDADFPEGFAGASAPGAWDDLIGSNGVVYDDLDALTLAMSFYFHSHASKLQVDYTWLDESSTLSDHEDELDNDVFRAQYQVKF